MSAKRKLLGREASYGVRSSVFLVEDALEIDEVSIGDIERKRVYFDDVLALTYHREFGPLVLFLSGILAVGLILIALAVPREGTIVLLGFAFPFLLIFLLRIILRVDVVTVFGRRTRTRLRFSFRKARAREIYRELAEKIRARQEKIAAELAPPPAPEPPPLPPGPPPAAPPPGP